LRKATRYAIAADGTRLALQVVGEGAIAVLFVQGFVSHVEFGWEEPRLTAFFDRLSSFSRLIIFDQHGTGLSDPAPPRTADDSEPSSKT
jgi:pimeloyl-ACP methyl ester carboxylesterase